MLLNFVTCLFLFPQSVPVDSSFISSPIDSTGKVVIAAINIIGNKITKRNIILREIPFHEGDTLSYSNLKLKIKKSTQNLLNSSLFNFVNVDTFDTRFGTTKIMVRVTERWYTFPIPIFEIADRNFNTWWETKDLTRINYGFFLNRDNFRGRKETVALIAQFGYSQQFGFAYRVPYLNSKQRTGMGGSFVWTRNHEIAYGSMFNKVKYFKDPNDYARRELAAKLNYTYRNGIYNTFTLESKYFNGYVEDTITKLTTDYFVNNKRSTEFLSLELFSKRDCRDSKPYPLKGYYLDATISKVGFGLLPNEKVDLWYFIASAKKYFKLSNRFYLAGSVRGKMSSKTDQPYYNQRGLGYNDYVRSYEYYVVDGQKYVLSKIGFKYQIIKPHVQKIAFIGSEKFNTFHYALYAEAFADGGYVEDKKYLQINNPLSDHILYGYGVGLNYVTYYDTVLRLEFAVNKNSEYGFFIHLSAPI